MAQNRVNIGELPDDGTGDVIRDAFDIVNKELDVNQGHRDDVNNPHSVTASQVGAYTRQEADDKIQDFLVEVQAGVVSPQQLAEALAGVVVARSTTSITLVEGQRRTLTLTPQTRTGFNANTFGVVSRLSTPDDYAVTRLVSYDPLSGALVFDVLTRTGASGPFSDWEVASLSSSTVAQVALLARGVTVRDESVAARDLARSWATKTDGEVQFGLGYSAKQYALNSAGFAAAASTSADNAYGSEQRAKTWDPTNYYDKLTIDDKFTTLRGGVSATYDTLGKLADALASNTSSIASISPSVNRALRSARLFNVATYP